MIAELLVARGVGLGYALGAGPRMVSGRAQIVAGSLAGSNEKELTREFDLVVGLRPDVTNRFYHIYFSVGNGERLSWEACQEIAEQTARVLDHDCHVSIQHSDTPVDHLHYIGSRVHQDGTLARENLREYARMEAICCDIEKKYGLQETNRPIRGEGVHGRAQLEFRSRSFREEALEEQSGQMSHTRQLEWHVRQSLGESENSLEWLAALERHGVAVIARRKEGRVGGLTFVQQGTGWKCNGSTLKLPAAKIDTMLGLTLGSGNKPAWDAHEARACAWIALAKKVSKKEKFHDHTRSFDLELLGRSPEHRCEDAFDMSSTCGEREPRGNRDAMGEAERTTPSSPGVRDDNRAWSNGNRVPDAGAIEGGGVAEHPSVEGSKCPGIPGGSGDSRSLGGGPRAVGRPGESPDGLEGPLPWPVEPSHNLARSTGAGGGGLRSLAGQDASGGTLGHETPGSGCGGPAGGDSPDCKRAHEPSLGLPASGVGAQPGEGAPHGATPAGALETTATPLIDDDLDELFSPRVDLSEVLGVNIYGHNPRIQVNPGQAVDQNSKSAEGAGRDKTDQRPEGPPGPSFNSRSK